MTLVTILFNFFKILLNKMKKRLIYIKYIFLYNMYINDICNYIKLIGKMSPKEIELNGLN